MLKQISSIYLLLGIDSDSEDIQILLLFKYTDAGLLPDCVAF
jgi:hypothetical protein